MNLEYLYEAKDQFSSPTNAVIVLPEIFGLTDFITGVADKFSIEFSMPAYALDFFYQLNHTPNKFNYDTDTQKGVELMQQMTGDDFLIIFNDAIEKIVTNYPSIQSLVVCGFCFGGRLAYLSGLNSKVNKIISFYGAGANQPNYIDGKACIEALAARRTNDQGLKILSFYGGTDESIPPEDRAKTKRTLTQANINYQEVIYDDAGHAFFNHQRDQMYNKQASELAWQKIVEFTK